MDDGSETKKAKGTKKSLIKTDLMVKNYKECLLSNKIILKSRQVFRSDHHNVYTVEINKIGLSSDDDKRLQTLGRFTTYRHGTNAFKVCESEIMIVSDLLFDNYTDCLFYDEILLQPQQR